MNTEETTHVEETPVETEVSTEETSATEPEVTTEEAPVEEVATEVIETKALDVRAGQTIRVHERIKDFTPKGEPRERIQIFEGIVLGIKGAGVSRTFTIRKISSGGFAVEKIYPINSPVVAKIELVKTAHVRRAKLTFLQKSGKRLFKRKLKEVHEDLGKKKKKGRRK